MKLPEREKRKEKCSSHYSAQWVGNNGRLSTTSPQTTEGWAPARFHWNTLQNNNVIIITHSGAVLLSRKWSQTFGPKCIYKVLSLFNDKQKISCSFFVSLCLVSLLLLLFCLYLIQTQTYKHDSVFCPLSKNSSVVWCFLPSGFLMMPLKGDATHIQTHTHTHTHTHGYSISVYSLKFIFLCLFCQLFLSVFLHPHSHIHMQTGSRHTIRLHIMTMTVKRKIAINRKHDCKWIDFNVFYNLENQLPCLLDHAQWPNSGQWPSKMQLKIDL